MLKPIQIKEDLYYIGVNDRTKNLFENLWPLPKGVSYNSYLITDEKTALFDTVDVCYSDIFFHKLEIALNGKELDYVIINHNAGGYYTVYMHMKEFYVSEGQTVARGQKIGAMGNTGEVYPVPSASNPYGGTHLHFEARIGGAYGTSINPLGLF